MPALPLQRRHCCPVALTLATLSAAGMVVGSFFDVDADALFRVSLAFFLVAALSFIALRTGATAAVIERARQDGYSRGYREGRTVARPVVLPITLHPARDAPTHPRDLRQEQLAEAP